MPALDETGEVGFLAGLRRCGVKPEKKNNVVVFPVVPVGGSHARESIGTGVSIDELTAWPSAPPHWVHLPGSVNLSRTHTKPSPILEWMMHSRSIPNWGNAEEPAQAWLAHVRAVLEES